MSPAKKKTQQEVSDRASAGLLGLINCPMIAPFLVTRADSENRADNWIREISPWASKMAALIMRVLTGRTGSSLSAFQGGRNFFWSLVPLPWCLTGEPLAGRHTWTVWGPNSYFIPPFSWIYLSNPGEQYEENSSSQLQMGRETIHCGLWYVHSYPLFFLHLFTFVYCINNHLGK